MGDVAVIVPTLRRPESLERALCSLFQQTGVGDRLESVVVVDNDPAASAATVVESLRAVSPWPLTYVHAPHPGVATATLTRPPIHRWSFSEAAGAAPEGTVVSDSLGGLTGVIKGNGATLTGSGVTLPGGAPATLPAGSITRHRRAQLRRLSRP